MKSKQSQANMVSYQEDMNETKSEMKPAAPERGTGRRFARLFANAKLASGGYEEIFAARESLGVVHVFETPSRTDLACFKAAYANAGLPLPLKDATYPAQGQSSVTFLSKNVKGINHDIASLTELILWQKKNDFPVALLPQLVFYGNRPGRTGPERWWDRYTGPQDRPRLIRKWLKIISANGGAVAQAGEPVMLRQFLARPDVTGLPDAAQARMLLDTLRKDFQNQRRLMLGPPVKPKEVMKDKVKRHPMLVKAVAEEARSSARSEWQVWDDVNRLLNSMMADYDVRFIRMWEIVLSWVWRTFFEGIAVDRIGLERARKLARKTPVIYVPCHKSHTDYLLVSYVFFANHMTPPHIGAGANLNFWPLGYIFRKSGAFFLRRSFKSEKIYPAVFETYLRTLMHEGFDLEFFMEGGRSRTGKLFLPKMGILSMMLRAFEEGEAPDLNFVPISIGYDRVPEEQELLGETQLTRFLPPGWRGMLEILRRNNGLIHLNFAAPVSLRQYLESRHAEPMKMDVESRRALLRDFAFRLIHSINEVSVVTPNALAAAALLARVAPAVEEAQVRKDAELLLRFMEHSRAPITPTLRRLDSAISEALKLNRAQNFLSDLKLPGDEGGPMLIGLDHQKRPYLEMYKNNIIQWLYPAAIVATSLLAKKDGSTQADLEDDYRNLMLILKYELVYDAEKSVEAAVEDALKFFEGEGFVGKSTNIYNATLQVTDAGRLALPIFAGQIENFLEAYKLAFEQGRPEDDKAEQAFPKKMVHVGLRAYHLGTIKRRESISAVTFKNALSLMKHLEKIGKSDVITASTMDKFLK